MRILAGHLATTDYSAALSASPVRARHKVAYARGEAPLGCAEPKDDLSAEYDDDVRPFLDHESASDQSDEFPEWVP